MHLRFSATTYEVGLSWQASRPVPKEGSYLFDFDRFDSLEWVLSPSYKIYAPYDSTHQKTVEESEQKLGLVGMSLAVPLSMWFSLTASTHWAMTGNSGSYAEGLLGGQLSTPEFGRFAIKAHLKGEIGAGAGGNINTESGGYVVQALAGFEVPISKYTSLDLNGGKMQTSDGRFNANTLVVALNFHMNLLFEK